MLKEVKDKVKELIRKGYLYSKISTGELHVSLNPRMLNEIRKEIEEI